MKTIQPRFSETNFSFFTLSESIKKADNGDLVDISLMTVGEANRVYIDDKTLMSIKNTVRKGKIKAFVDHGYSTSPTDIIGFFSEIHVEGTQVRARKFKFLDAFKKNYEDKYDTILELSEVAPESFGTSFMLQGEVKWVTKHGIEIKASRDYWSGKWLNKPEEALRGVPSLRVNQVLSADFVDRPAANPNGLFQAEEELTKSKDNMDEVYNLLISLGVIKQATHEMDVAKEVKAKFGELQAASQELSNLKPQAEACSKKVRELEAQFKSEQIRCKEILSRAQESKMYTEGAKAIIDGNTVETFKDRVLTELSKRVDLQNPKSQLREDFTKQEQDDDEAEANPYKKGKAFNYTEQMKLLKKDPAKAEQFRKEAQDTILNT